MKQYDMPEYIEKQVLLSPYTTLRIGGCAEYFATVTSHERLRESVLWAKKNNLRITILGGGSNVLVNDAGIKGLVLHIVTEGILYHETESEVLTTVASGMEFDALVSELVQKEIWGLENLSGIPGSVGAVPIQNVGAYGVEVAEFITSVVAYDIEADQYVVFSNEECGFRYRSSFFKSKHGKKYVVVWVTFTFKKNSNPKLSYKDLQSAFGEGATPTLGEIRDAVLLIRSAKFPDWHTIGTAGSFFKNPILQREHFSALKKRFDALPGFQMPDGSVKIPLGWILDHLLHLKGFRKDAISLYENHALVLVTTEGVTAKEVTRFAEEIQEQVRDATDIVIEWEVTPIQ